VRVENADEENIVVGSLNSNEDLVRLILLLDALKGRKIAVIPYMGYARQDKMFLEGEAVSIKTLAKLLENLADHVITVNIHSREAASHFKKLHNLDAMPLIGEFYSSRQDLVMISPDVGSYDRVKSAASVAGCEFDYLEKKRIDATSVEIKPKEIDVAGRDVVIVDDIISTGGTVVEAAKKLKELGARKVEAACVHAVLADFATIKLISAGIRELVATDTVECVFSSISVSKLVSDAISNLVF
jgi:ribose-phosphate pyrophosphokinase